MNINELDTVVLKYDMADHGLERGDIGAVVQIYSTEAIEVEFVTASGRTQAVVTLKPAQIRALDPGDMPAVRQLGVA